MEYQESNLQLPHARQVPYPPQSILCTQIFLLNSSQFSCHSLESSLDYTYFNFVYFRERTHPTPFSFPFVEHHFKYVPNSRCLDFIKKYLKNVSIYFQFLLEMLLICNSVLTVAPDCIFLPQKNCIPHYATPHSALNKFSYKKLNSITCFRFTFGKLCSVSINLIIFFVVVVNLVCFCIFDMKIKLYYLSFSFDIIKYT